jgi:hypothetical protein
VRRAITKRAAKRKASTNLHLPQGEAGKQKQAAGGGGLARVCRRFLVRTPPAPAGPPTPNQSQGRQTGQTSGRIRRAPGIVHRWQCRHPVRWFRLIVRCLCCNRSGEGAWSSCGPQLTTRGTRHGMPGGGGGGPRLSANNARSCCCCRPQLQPPQRAAPPRRTHTRADITRGAAQRAPPPSSDGRPSCCSCAAVSC